MAQRVIAHILPPIGDRRDTPTSFLREKAQPAAHEGLSQRFGFRLACGTYIKHLPQRPIFISNLSEWHVRSFP